MTKTCSKRKPGFAYGFLMVAADCGSSLDEFFMSIIIVLVYCNAAYCNPDCDACTAQPTLLAVPQVVWSLRVEKYI